MTEAEKERAAIVAWLREEAKAQMRICENNARFHGYETAAKAQMLSARYEEIADAVSRGDHLQETANDQAGR